LLAFLQQQFARKTYVSAVAIGLLTGISKGKKGRALMTNVGLHLKEHAVGPTGFQFVKNAIRAGL
jgi:hypothetical protein